MALRGAARRRDGPHRSGRELASTGSRSPSAPARAGWTCPAPTSPGVRYLRDLDDAVQLRARLAAARRVVVVGGGFIGLEAAAAARVQGADVTVVEAADRLVARAVAPVVSEFYRQAHERRGTRVLLRTAVAGFEGDGAGPERGPCSPTAASCPADLVVVGIGVVPRTELAEQLGLALRRRHRRRRPRPHQRARASSPRATAPCCPTR